MTLYYFPSDRMQGDIDNIVKPVLDALCRHVHVDDQQVERVWVQKFEPGKIFRFSAPSDVLSSAIQGEKPLLYVRLSDDPAEGLTWSHKPCSSYPGRRMAARRDADRRLGNHAAQGRLPGP